jgi:hypothetical protein
MRKKATINIPEIEAEVEPKSCDLENDRHYMFDVVRRPDVVGSDCR